MELLVPVCCLWSYWSLCAVCGAIGPCVLSVELCGQPIVDLDLLLRLLYQCISPPSALRLQGHLIHPGITFDTVRVTCNTDVADVFKVQRRANERRINLRYFDDNSVSWFHASIIADTIHLAPHCRLGYLLMKQCLPKTWTTSCLFSTVLMK